MYGELLKRTWEPSWMQDEHLREALYEKLSVAMKRTLPQRAREREKKKERTESR